MPRSPMNRLEELRKKTLEYKNNVFKRGENFFDSPEAEEERLDLCKRYGELEDLIKEAHGGTPSISIYGQRLDVFANAYSGSDGLVVTKTIPYALQAISKTIGYFNPKKQLNNELLKPKNTVATSSTKDVFIIHGHDSTLEQEVVKYIFDLGLNPIVLHEQPNKGRTVIEKFESHATMSGYAIALFTGDDLGGKDKDTLKPRARQNVVFEFGFFMGHLGRAKTAILYGSDVEKPSDWEGIVYISLEEDWKNKLLIELKSADMDIHLSSQ